MKKNKIMGFVIALFLSFTSLCFAYEYEVHIELKDGSVYDYNGSTGDPNYQSNRANHFGHNPEGIANETETVIPWEAP